MSARRSFGDQYRGCGVRYSELSASIDLLTTTMAPFSITSGYTRLELHTIVLGRIAN